MAGKKDIGAKKSPQTKSKRVPRTKLPKKPVTLGRPTKYKPEYDEMAFKLCQAGYVNRELAEFFGVAESSIDLWISKHESFSGRVRAGRIGTDLQVVNAAFNSALDREVIEEQAIKIRDQKEPGVFTEEVVVVPVKRFIPGDPRAQQFWLTCRQPDKWNTARLRGARDEDSHVDRPVVLLPDGSKLQL